MSWTCDICNYSLNSDDKERCMICNSFHSNVTSSNGQDAPLLQPVSAHYDNVLSSPRHSSSTNANAVSAHDHSGSKTEISLKVHGHKIHSEGKIVSGRVSHVEQRDERPPFNIYRTLTWVLIWILIGVPFAVLFTGSAIISFCFAIIGFRTLSQFFNPITWTLAVTEIMEVIVLRRFRSDDRIPVFRGMVEDRDSREHSFMMLGPLQRGNIFVGQNIELSGHWHQGTFIVHNGTDLTTGARITSAYRNPWRSIFFLIAGLWMISVFLLFMNLENIVDLLRQDMVR